MPSISKSEETGRKILDAALELFRDEGFEQATMRDIAQKAGVATGAAYYYFPSKEAIVMAFYERSCREMQPLIHAAVEKNGGLEARLRELIRVKFDYFAPNRTVLRGLLKNGADPTYPLSPFSPETKAIREIDLAWFRKILADCGVRIPRDLEPHMPEVLWMFQMGVIYFWLFHDSKQSERLLELGSKTITALLRLSALPLTRPLRKVALELIELVQADGNVQSLTHKRVG